MKKTVRLSNISVVIAAVIVSVSLQSNAGEHQVYLTFRRHVLAEYTNAIADSKLLGGTNISRNYDYVCSDIPCAIEFKRSGQVEPFGSSSDGLAIITDQSDLDDVFDVSGDVKVVIAINWCNGAPTSGSILGCGRTNDSMIVIENANRAVYVHEYGHVVGRDHRDGCSENIMNSSCCGSALNEAECEAMGADPFAAKSGSIYDGQGGPLTASNGPYWVNGNITVPSGQTLTVYPGTLVQMNNDISIAAPGGGQLIVQGGSEDTVFYSN